MLLQYVNQELSDVQGGFRKGRETRDQIANIHWIMETVREFQKNIYFCFIDYTKAFDCVKVSQSCPTLCDPMDYTVHGILQARILECVAILFSRGSSQPRDGTQVSHIAGRFFTSWATGEADLTVWIATNWKILKEGGIPDHLTCLLRNSMRVKKQQLKKKVKKLKKKKKKQQLEPNMEQQTGSKLGKEYNKAIYCHPSNFTYM